MRSTQEQREMGSVLLSGLAQALADYGQDDAAVQGALVWQRGLPAKQEVDQAATWLARLWRFVRIFLLSSRF